MLFPDGDRPALDDGSAHRYQGISNTKVQLHQAIGSGSISACVSSFCGREKPLGSYRFQKRAREAGGNTDLSLEIEYVNSIAWVKLIGIESVGLQVHKEFIKIVSAETRSTGSARRDELIGGIE